MDNKCIGKHCAKKDKGSSGSKSRVATVREKYLENEIFSRSGKSQGILWIDREI